MIHLLGRCSLRKEDNANQLAFSKCLHQFESVSLHFIDRAFGGELSKYCKFMLFSPPHIISLLDNFKMGNFMVSSFYMTKF